MWLGEVETRGRLKPSAESPHGLKDPRGATATATASVTTTATTLRRPGDQRSFCVVMGVIHTPPRSVVTDAAPNFSQTGTSFTQVPRTAAFLFQLQFASCRTNRCSLFARASGCRIRPLTSFNMVLDGSPPPRRPFRHRTPPHTAFSLGRERPSQWATSPSRNGACQPSLER